MVYHDHKFDISKFRSSRVKLNYPEAPHMLRSLLTAAALLAFAPDARAQNGAGSPPPDRAPGKSAFHLFNPTPRDLRRDLSADRPDFTESPYTVDAGAVQLEMSFIDYASRGSADTWTAAPFNLKLGVLNDLDLQFVFDPFVREDDGMRSRKGVGDIEVRAKFNLWGNDEGDTAFAFMPFIKAPTASHGLGNDHVEGGLIFPFAVDLAEGVGLGLMFETDFVFDGIDDGYDTEFIFTAALGLDVTETLGVYLEGIAIESTDPGVDLRGILGLGATLALTSDLILDAGVNLGLTGDADDFSIFSGLTIRF